MEKDELVTQEVIKVIRVIDIIDNNNKEIVRDLIMEASEELQDSQMSEELQDSQMSEELQDSRVPELLMVERLHIGNTTGEEVVLDVTGDTVINGTLYIKHVADEEYYITGNSSPVATYNLLPGDGYRIVYADSTASVVNIILGTIDNNNFERNRRITFKDVSLELGTGSMHNVNIIVPNCGTRIEYYHNGVLTVSPNAGYSINTNGGAVTLRYFVSPIPNIANTWVIESQLLGQPRILPSIVSRPTSNRSK